jgi:hypothetical protein
MADMPLIASRPIGDQDLRGLRPGNGRPCTGCRHGLLPRTECACASIAYGVRRRLVDEIPTARNPLRGMLSTVYHVGEKPRRANARVMATRDGPPVAAVTTYPAARAIHSWSSPGKARSYNPSGCACARRLLRGDDICQAGRSEPFHGPQARGIRSFKPCADRQRCDGLDAAN